MGKVLIIEDDDQTRALIGHVVEAIGHEFEATNNGHDGLEMAYAIQPDLIIMDVRLPGQVDGRDVTRLIKSDAQMSHIPIMIVSVPLSPADDQYAREAGCDEYLPKPFHIQKLKDSILNYL